MSFSIRKEGRFRKNRAAIRLERLEDRELLSTLPTRPVAVKPPPGTLPPVVVRPPLPGSNLPPGPRL